jgi:hypothetical protein
MISAVDAPRIDGVLLRRSRRMRIAGDKYRLPGAFYTHIDIFISIWSPDDRAGRIDET